ncbi:MAG: DUF945 family protein, partial [Gammaproteobacteria bacterium]
LHGVPAHTPMLWLGDGAITVRAISFEPVAREDLIPVSVDRLRLNYSLEGIDAGFDVKGGYAVKRVVLAGHSVDDLVLELNTGTYDRVAIMQYVETANRLQSAAAAQHSPQDAQAIVGAADELRESALRVLTLGRPTARLERVGFSYGGGRIDGNATVRYVGGVHARGLNPFTDFEGAFSLKGAKSTVKAIVAEFLARSQYGDRLASLPDEKRDAVTGATQFQLDAVSKNGMLKDTGDDYAVDATFKRGALRLNGVPVSLPGGTPAR